MKNAMDEAIINYPGLSLHVFGYYNEGERESQYEPLSGSEFDIRDIRLIEGDLIDLILSNITIEKIEEDVISKIENN